MIIPLNFLKGNSVKQSFQFTVNTANVSSGSSTNIQYRLPLVSTGIYNMVVDWGDGTTSTITTWNDVATTHTYPTVGIYEIEITGVCDGWRQSNTGVRSKIILVSRWGCLKITTDAAFYGCNNMYTTAPDILTITSTSTANMFRFCIYATLPNANDWNVSSVTNMTSMFQQAYRFNAPINKWNVSNVINMTSMFAGVNTAFINDFNQNIGNWNTSKVTSMSSMFQYSKFNNGGNPSINNWNTSNVTTMLTMFRVCPNFNQPIGNWNISKVTTMNGMFTAAELFNQPLNSWNTSSVTNMSGMFQGAASFNQPINNWNVSNVTTMASMFQNSAYYQGKFMIFNQSLTGWNVSKVTTTANMFNFCEFNSSIDNWNLAAITTMQGMFDGAFGFNASLNNWTIGSNINNMSSMFKNCFFSFNQNLSSWTFLPKLINQGVDCTDIFNGCKKFNNGGQPLTWTIRISKANNMFSGCELFNQNIGSFLFSNTITEMYSMFENCTAFNNGGSPDINNWQLTGTTPINAQLMFRSAIAFNQPINNLFSVTPLWNTAGVFFLAESFDQNIGSWKFQLGGNESGGPTFIIANIFSGALSFNNGGSPDINNWDFSGIDTTYNDSGFGYMFDSAISFNQPIGNWDVNGIASFDSMFKNAVLFNQDISGWVAPNCYTTERMFNNAYAFNNGGQPMPLGDMFPSLINAELMFAWAESFDQDITGINNVFSNLENARLMFALATSFNNGGQQLPNLNMPFVTDVSAMFNTCISFNQNVGPMFLGGNNGPIDCGYMFAGSILFNNGGSPDINESYIGAPTSISAMFANCPAFNQSLENWTIDTTLYGITPTADRFMEDKTSTTYPSTTYDALLNGWYNNINGIIPYDIIIDFGTAQYSAAGQPGRDGLINDYGWIITDGGLA